VITPAISVLSAIEGLQVATPAFGPVVVPLTILILILLFLAQKRGTAQIGAIFGRVMLLWFATIAALGIHWIIREPSILRAVNPVWALEFFSRNGIHGFLVLGAVVLCITGGEALYADMGHFGKSPIRTGWFWLVFPALLLNYFGQGALVLHSGAAAIDNPFYGLAPTGLVYPLVALATAATVIASQALISGAFSLTQQAVQLGYFPRMAILHTSRETEGQIFVPRANRLLMIACVLLVLVFQESSALAAAYGIAVTGTMAITSLLFLWVARRRWGWSALQAYSLVAVFLAIDLAFFGANLVKFAEGGWVPILIAGAILTLMLTWKQGRAVLSQHMRNRAVPLDEFISEMVAKKTYRVPGTAVFMALSRKVAPAVLLHHVRHNHCLHERVILLSILTEQVPSISARERVRVTELSGGFVEVIARYGYMEFPDISEVLICAASAGLAVDIGEVSFFLGRETILPNGDSGMPHWQKRIFIFFSKNARTATEFFNLPPDQVTEVGAQINI
jgi:KUP system potassium uptake protein